MPIKRKILPIKTQGFVSSKLILLIIFIFIILATIYFVFRFKPFTVSSKQNQKKDTNIYVEMQNDKIVDVYAVNSEFTDTDLIDPMVLTNKFTISSVENIAYTNIKPVTTLLTTRFKESINENGSINFSKSKIERVSIYKYKIPTEAGDKFKINLIDDNSKVSSGVFGQYSISSLLNESKSLNHNNFNPSYEPIFTNTDNRTRDKALDIFIVGLCFETEPQTFNNLAEQIKNKIIQGDYFKDNKNRFNIFKVTTYFDSTNYRCQIDSANATRISNVLKPVGAENIFVIANDNEQFSYSLQPSTSYLGTVFLSKKVADLDHIAIHDLGHTLGFLWDEYSSTNFENEVIKGFETSSEIKNQPLTDTLKAQASLNDFQNCQTSCKLFNLKYIPNSECIPGCGFSNKLYRTTKTSVMQNLNGTFNAISKDALEYNLSIYAPKVK